MKKLVFILFLIATSIIIRNFTVTIKTTNGVYYFSPIRLKWKTEITTEILDISNTFDPSILDFLFSNPKIQFGYSLHINEGGKRFILLIRGEKKIIPYSFSKLKDLLKGIIGVTGISNIKFMESLFPNSYNFINLNFEGSFNNISQFINSLDRDPHKDYIFHTEICSESLVKFQSIIRFINSEKYENFIKNGSKISNSEFTDEFYKNPSIRYFGKDSKTVTNKILDLIRSTKSNQTQPLYNLMINKLTSIERNPLIVKKDSEYDKCALKILKGSRVNFSIFKIQVIIGMKYSMKNHKKNLMSLSKISGFSFHKNKKLQYLNLRESWRLLKIPVTSKLNVTDNKRVEVPHSVYSQENPIGKILINGVEHSPFGFNLTDFAEGGVISGAIGTGKTTLRLHIIEYLLKKNVQIIDFDLKGDAPRYPTIGNNGIILIPGVNFHLNPFECPPEFGFREYSDLLVRTFLETIPNVEFSPAQTHLLTKAVFHTVETKGNSRSFYQNILVLSEIERRVIDNYQEATAQSLITRFGWLQDSLGAIFWRNDSTLSSKDFKSTSIFFDLSSIIHTASHNQIRFLIDIVMTQFMASNKDTIGNISKGKPSTVIFVDEAQILMPNFNKLELSRLEETISTLRYKGVSVIGTGISTELMSPVFLETNFIAQYRSDSSALIKSLGYESNDISISKIPSYHAIIRSKSTNLNSFVVSINDFTHIQDKDEYYVRVREQLIQQSNVLNEYKISFQSLWEARISSLFITEFLIQGEYRKKLLKEAELFVNCLLDVNLFNKLTEFIIEKYEWAMNKKILSQKVREDPNQFLMAVLLKFYNFYVETNFKNAKFSTFKRNYEAIINDSIQKMKKEAKNIFPILDSQIHTQFHLILARINNQKMITDPDKMIFPSLAYSYLIHFMQNSIFNEKKISEYWSGSLLIGTSYDLGLIDDNQYTLFLNFVNKYESKMENKLSQLQTIKLAQKVGKEIIQLEKLNSISL